MAKSLGEIMWVRHTRAVPPLGQSLSVVMQWLLWHLLKCGRACVQWLLSVMLLTVVEF